MSQKGRRVVLILAEAGDVHAAVVANRLLQEHDAPAIVWDTSRFPQRDEVSFSIDAAEDVAAVVDPHGLPSVDLMDVRSIWWRRPTAARVGADVGPPYMQAYCRRECRNLLRGIFAVTSPPIFNDPDSEQISERKLLQLATAKQVGLTVPRTLATNSPDRVLDFYDDLRGKVIFKPFAAPPTTFYGTQRLERHHLNGLGLLQRSPIIFQEEITPQRDIRVTVVGDRLFAAESDSKNLDWRLDSSIRWTSHELPRRVTIAIQRLMRSLDLDMGSLDFRMRGEEYVFLEVNPNGQFLFLEADDPSLGISSAVAELLARQ